MATSIIDIINQSTQASDLKVMEVGIFSKLSYYNSLGTFSDPAQLKSSLLNNYLNASSAEFGTGSSYSSNDLAELRQIVASDSFSYTTQDFGTTLNGARILSFKDTNTGSVVVAINGMDLDYQESAVEAVGDVTGVMLSVIGLPHPQVFEVIEKLKQIKHDLPEGAKLDVSAHSLGANIVQWIKILEPGLIDGAVLFNPVGVGGILATIGNWMSGGELQNALYDSSLKIITSENDIAQTLGVNLSGVVNINSNKFFPTFSAHQNEQLVGYIRGDYDENSTKAFNELFSRAKAGGTSTSSINGDVRTVVYTYQDYQFTEVTTLAHNAQGKIVVDNNAHVVVTGTHNGGQLLGETRTFFEGADLLHTVTVAYKENGNKIVTDTVGGQSITFVIAADTLIPFDLLGGKLGSMVADYFASGKVVHDLITAAIFLSLGEHTGTFLQFIATQESVIKAWNAFSGDGYYPELYESFTQNLENGIAGRIGTLIASEFGEILDIDTSTYLGGVINSAINSVSVSFVSESIDVLFDSLNSNVFANIADGHFFQQAVWMLDGKYVPVNTPGAQLEYKPINIKDLISNAIGAYLGAKLAGEVILPESQQAAIFGAIGSSIAAGVFGTAFAAAEIGSGVATATVSGWLSSTSLVSTLANMGIPAGPLGVAIGVFVGTVVGTFLGNAFGGQQSTPASWARLEYDPNEKEYDVTQTWSNGGLGNQIGENLGAQVVSGFNAIIEASHGTLRQGSTAQSLQIGMKANDFIVTLAGGDSKEFGTATDAINYAAFQILKGYDLVGGYAILMRAWHNSDAKNIFEFQQDIQVAEAFQAYLADPTKILVLMMNSPESIEAQTWAAILQRAAELELHLPSEDDFDGGWSEVLIANNADPSMIPSLENDTVTLTDPVTGETTVIHHIIGPGYEIVRIEGTDGEDTIHVVVDGPSVSYVDAGEGNDTIIGSDQNDILVGGGGNDTIIGNDGNDWLHGGSGEDNIDGGKGEDLIVGAEHNDVLLGGVDIDTIYGNDGDDYLRSGMGVTDYLYGGKGNDTLEGNLAYGKGHAQLANAEMGTSAVTFSMTFKSASNVTDDYLFHYATTSQHHAIKFYNNTLYTLLYFDGVMINTGYNGFQSADWQTMTLSWDVASGQIKMYDGTQLVFSTILSGTHTVDSGGKLTIGQFMDSWTQINGGHALNAEVSQFTVWDRVVSSSELSAGANRSDAIHDFAFNAGTGSTLTNLAGNGDATLYGDYEWVNAPGGGYQIKFNDQSNSGPTTARLYGEQGDDHLIFMEDDIGNGGEGNDTLEFRNSGSVAEITRGEGHDIVIATSDAVNVIRFDETISPNELYFKQDNEDLKILVLGEDQSVTVKNFFGTQNIPNIIIQAFDVAYQLSSRSSILAAIALDATIAGTPTGKYNYLSDAAIAAGVYDFDPGVTSPWQVISSAASAKGGDGSQTYYLDPAHAYGIGGAGNDQIRTTAYSPGYKIYAGDSGDDTLFVTAGNQVDIMSGGLGNDYMVSNDGNDRLYGGYGDDYLLSQQGNDIVYGGAGNDIIVESIGDDIYYAGDGDDSFHHEDAVVHDTGSNVIKGGDGNDTIDIHFNTNNDFIDGENGNDFIYAGSGADTLDGGAGNDTISGGAGNDWISGGSDNDVLFGDAGDDIINGGSENDILKGHSGIDTILGAEGDDNLDGGSGNDKLEGGAGNDIYQYNDSINVKPVAFNKYTTNGYAQLANAEMGTSAVTFSMTFKSASNVTDDYLFHYATTSQHHAIKFYNNTLYTLLYFDGVMINTGYNGFQSADWQTMTLSWDVASGQIKMYDGTQLVFSTILSGTHTVDSGGKLTIGQFMDSWTQINGGHALNAEVSQFTVWDRVVSSSELSAGANRSDAIHDFAFNAGTGSTLTNLVGNGDATLYGDYEWVNAPGGGVQTIIGNDWISDSSGNDSISFNNDITFANLTFERDLADQDDLIIKSSGTQIINVENQFSSSQIENLKFKNQADVLIDSLEILLTGDQSNNVLTATSQNDRILAGAGADTLSGGLGSNYLDGGDGIDTVTYNSLSSGSGVSVDLSLTGAQNTVSGTIDTIVNIENIIGSANNDNLTGNSVDNVIDGGVGNDLIEGGAGNDTLTGGLGIDTLSYAHTPTSGIAVNLSLTSAQNTGNAGLDTLSGFENILGSSFADTLIGDTGNNVVEGGAGNDILNGGDGIDTVSYATSISGVTVNLNNTNSQNTGAGSGSDRISNFENILGSSHADTLTGNSGANTIDGGSGDDIITGGSGDDVLIGGLGVDTISYSSTTVGVVVDLNRISAQYTLGDGTDTISGFENILGSAYADSLYGDENDNNINGGNGSDLVFGGGGNDILIGGGGTDTLTYAGSTSGISINLALTTAQNTIGAGIDTISQFEYVIGSSFNDVIMGDAAFNTIEGGDGDDVLNGGSGTNTLNYLTATGGITINLSLTTAQNTGGAGVDTISNFSHVNGSTFNDFIYGSSGNNTLIGGTGNDYIDGSSGVDNIDGGSGDDNLFGGGNYDTINYASAISGVTISLAVTGAQNTGGAGIDTISQFENIIGSSFDDLLTGDVGVNIINGGAGDDVIYGGGGNDTIEGGAGTDIIVASGSGTSTVSYSSAASAVTVNLAIMTAQITNGAGTDTISGFKNLTGSGYADILTGNSDANTISGGNGSDKILGAGGADTLTGGSSADTFIFNAATLGSIDTITDFSITTGQKDIIELRSILQGYVAGTSLITDFVEITTVGTSSVLKVDLDGGANSFVQIATLQNIVGLTDEGALLASGQIIVTFPDAYGTTGNDTLNGTSGNNIIHGLAGNDIINGLAGNDELYGWAGNDVIDGGLGDDVIDGGADTDTVSYATAGSGVKVALSITSIQNTVGAGFDSIASVENLTGSAYDDVLSGNSGDNVLVGGSGVDTVSYRNATAAVTISLALSSPQNTGGAGTDTITGFENFIGSDFGNNITGSTGNNIIEGGAGNDTLNGGNGNDTLSYVNASAGVTVSLATGLAQNTVGAGSDTLSNFENLTGSSLNDNLTGSSANNIMNGGIGNDVLIGGAGDDTIIGGDGLDTVSYTDATAAVSVSLAILTSQNVGGNRGSDMITEIENIIGSTSYNDTLSGNALANVLDGRGGADTMSGGAGNDRLIGGAGADILTGGADADTFIFDIAGLGTSDTITDFNVAQGDKLDISSIIQGYDPLTSLIDDFISFTTSGSNSIVKVDRDGTGSAYTLLTVASLTGVTGLDADNLHSNGNLVA